MIDKLREEVRRKRREVIKEEREKETGCHV